MPANSGSANNISPGHVSKFPLNRVTERHAATFYGRHYLPIEENVFIRGVLALRSQDAIETGSSAADESPTSRACTPTGCGAYLPSHEYKEFQRQRSVNSKFTYNFFV